MRVPLLITVCLLAVGAQAGEDVDWTAKFYEIRESHPVTNWNHLVACWKTNGFANASPIEQVRSTVEVKEIGGGESRAQLTAKTGAYRADGLLQGHDVRIVFFTPEGKPDGVITADEVIFDREKKIGLAIGRVVIDRDGDVLCGNHAVFSFADRFVRVLSDANVLTPRVKVRMDIR